MNRVVVIILFSLFCLQSFAQTDIRSFIDKGNALYAKQDYRSAAVTYKHACILDSTSFNAWYNFGNALYKLQKYILAADAYNKALQNTSDSKLQAQALYNVGNAYVKQDEIQKAVDSYKKSLLLNPNQPDCRYNLSFALKLIEQQQKNQNNSKNKNEKNKEPEVSAFAKQCKSQADALVLHYKFTDAYMVMKNGLEKDKTVGVYQEFIQRLQKISELTDTVK